MTAEKIAADLRNNVLIRHEAQCCLFYEKSECTLFPRQNCHDGLIALINGKSFDRVQAVWGHSCAERL